MSDPLGGLDPSTLGVSVDLIHLPMQGPGKNVMCTYAMATQIIATSIEHILNRRGARLHRPAVQDQPTFGATHVDAENESNASSNAVMIRALAAGKGYSLSSNG